MGTSSSRDDSTNKKSVIKEENALFDLSSSSVDGHILPSWLMISAIVLATLFLLVKCWKHYLHQKMTHRLCHHQPTMTTSPMFFASGPDQQMSAAALTEAAGAVRLHKGRQMLDSTATTIGPLSMSYPYYGGVPAPPPTRVTGSISFPPLSPPTLGMSASNNTSGEQRDPHRTRRAMSMAELPTHRTVETPLEMVREA